MEKVITVSDASVATTMVEVKVMKIGNKQVTLAVFRQLPEEQIIDHTTGRLLGQPWGRVNYHPDCNKATDSHFHIVWQKGNTLCRATIERRWSYPYLPGDLVYEGHNPVALLDFTLEAFLFARILEGWLPNAYEDKKYIYVEVEDERVKFEVEESSYPFTEIVRGLRELKGRQETCERWERMCQADADNRYYAEELERARGVYQQKRQEVEVLQHKVIETLEERGLPVNSKEIYWKELVPALHSLQQFRQAWRQAYIQLEQLDQLFIAV